MESLFISKNGPLWLVLWSRVTCSVLYISLMLLCLFCRPSGHASSRCLWRSVVCCRGARWVRWRWCERTSVFLSHMCLAPFRKSWEEERCSTSASTAYSLCSWPSTERNQRPYKQPESVWTLVLKPLAYRQQNITDITQLYRLIYCERQACL